MDSSHEAPAHASPIVSFVLPCLNESSGLERVVTHLHAHAQALGHAFEIIIADNGSTDSSQTIAKQLETNLSNVRLTIEPMRGYGAATRNGIIYARGAHIVCLDADDTYTANDAVTCAKRSIENPESFVIGNRLTSPDSKLSMPWSHRVIGTPAISMLLTLLFRTKVADPNCGLRGFSRAQFISLNCTTTGMEFASETIARATCAAMPFVEFPISYAPRIGESKLRTVRDGIRHAYTIFATRLQLLGMRR